MKVTLDQAITQLKLITNMASVAVSIHDEVTLNHLRDEITASRLLIARAKYEQDNDNDQSTKSP